MKCACTLCPNHNQCLSCRRKKEEERRSRRAEASDRLNELRKERQRKKYQEKGGKKKDAVAVKKEPIDWTARKADKTKPMTKQEKQRIRADSSRTSVKPCKKANKCEMMNNNGWFDCKSCRLQKCYNVGMTSTNFQFDRDPISTKLCEKAIPQSFERFLGRPHCVIFVEPEAIVPQKELIDCRELIGKASRIWSDGAASPLHSKTNLEKLAMALRRIDEAHVDGVKMVLKYGKEEVLSFFEQDFLKATRWFTYFDEFRELTKQQKLTMMQAMWHVFARLYKLSTAAAGKRRQIFDYSWCTKYSNEQMQHFIDNTDNNFLYKLLDVMVELKPNDVELSFMMCQACFHYAGQRFQGEILEATEKFQQILANELHEYYVHELRMNNYSGRLCQLLKINNKIREDIWKCRGKQEIAEVFDVYCIEYSHPEIFKDI
ncbi:unnamed protein product [Caenorhabditis sp. 36 PRJEB53466]|nr:unnamed protein product [Caenorhabditis sp. 36 PRJEB53466]